MEINLSDMRSTPGMGAPVKIESIIYLINFYVKTLKKSYLHFLLCVDPYEVEFIETVPHGWHGPVYLI